MKIDLDKRIARSLLLLSALAIFILGVMPQNAKPAAAVPVRHAGADPLFSIAVVHASACQSLQPVVMFFSQQPTPAQGVIPLPEGKGKETTQLLCGKCHSTNIFAQQRHTRDQWNSVIDNMVSKGLQATDDQLDEIVDYLAASFPPEPKRAVPPAPALYQHE